MRAFIFDLDGVLCPAEKINYESWLRLARKEKFKFDEIIFAEIKNLHPKDALNRLLQISDKNYDDEQIKRIIAKRDIFFSVLLCNLIRDDINKGVNDILFSLKRLGYKVGGVSSVAFAEDVLKKTAKNKLFDVIDCDAQKRNEFAYVAEKLGVNEKECYVLITSKWGIEQVDNSKFKVITLSEENGKNNSVLTIQEFSDIIEIALRVT